MKEVKEEKFGSRNSLLKAIFEKNKIDFIANIWIVTCRSSINKDKNSRYLVILEGEQEEKHKIEYQNLVNLLNPSIKIIHVNFDETQKKVNIFNVRDKKTGTVSYSKFRDRIIEITECQFLESYAAGSKNSTPLSRFFRENMGKGFALTDIDFYLTQKNVFIEEKNFIKNGIGYIGIGQCISFKEVVSDVFKNLKLLVICIENENYFVADFDTINCQNSEMIEGWGKMVPFQTERVSLEDLIPILST